MTANKATGNPEIRLDDDTMAACDTLHMWKPEAGRTPDGDALATSDLGQRAAKARLVLSERLDALGDFTALWSRA